MFDSIKDPCLLLHSVYSLVLLQQAVVAACRHVTRIAAAAPTARGKCIVLKAPHFAHSRDRPIGKLISFYPARVN